MGWKRLYLSKGGRVILIKSTLSNLPTYFLSLFPIPASVANRIEKLQRNFLWGSFGDDPKIHLVKWDTVCSPISSGGLGIRKIRLFFFSFFIKIRKIRLFNEALLGKWLWRFGIEEDALWRQVIEMKYDCVWGGWYTRAVIGPYGVGLWKNISQGWPSFSHHILYDIGDGSRVKFWQDQWCRETSLAVRYPNLFRFCRNKDANVAVLMMSTNGVLFWDVRFIRGVHARDLEAMSNFMVTIYGSPIRGRGEDKMCWIPNKVKGFLVSDYYKILSGSAFFGFPWKSIWKQKIPSRVAFLVWTAALGKCLTIDNLCKRKVWILDWCYMCKRNGESVDHLFLHCPFASDLWSMVLGLIGVSWVMPHTILGLLWCWQGSFGHHQNIYIWSIIPHCLLWCLWRERNSRCFEDTERSIPDLKLLFFRTLRDWLFALQDKSFPSFIDSLDSCNFCI